MNLNSEITMSTLNFTATQIFDVMETKGHKVFTSGNFNLNIVGIRSTDIDVNRFNDSLHVIYKDESGKWRHKAFTITTLAGLDYLKNPLNRKGTAILKAGQYRNSHQIGLHQGKYEALVQRGKMKVYRDDDQDSEHDFDPETIQEGTFGINIHRSSARGQSTKVGKWSAGCQVFANLSEFEIFMSICRKAKKVWGNSFTYTLLDEADFA